MPFLEDAIRWKPSAHLCSGIWLDSMTVPTLTENGSRQALHWYMPGRCDLPLTSVASPSTPQCGQTGPLGQRIASKWARAASSSLKIGSVRLVVMASPKFGLWLAKWALRLTGNRQLARASEALPLILARRFLILAEPADRS